VTLLALLIFLMLLVPDTATEVYFETARVLAGKCSPDTRPATSPSGRLVRYFPPSLAP
jgi:hypothetical protein